MELKQLGKYQVLAKIGEGSMGEVYRGLDPVLGRDVAIKTMVAGVGDDEELRKRFLREAQSAARLNHPNIITIYEFGEEQGQFYIAMELLEGRDLKELIARGTPTSLDEKMDLMEQMAEGLAFAHRRGVVHRDLKPANIHVQPDGQVKIMDFGLARHGTSDMTRAGALMGTPSYMSPEQVRGERASVQSDVFSLGAVFYELLSSRKAFSADTLPAVLFKISIGKVEPLADIVPDLPPSLCDVVEKALAENLNERFSDAGELREALRTVRAALGIAAKVGAAFEAGDRTTPPSLPQSATVVYGEARTLLSQPSATVPGETANDIESTKTAAEIPGAGGTAVRGQLSSPVTSHVEKIDKAARTTGREKAPQRHEQKLLLPAMVILAALALGIVIYFYSSGDVSEGVEAPPPAVKPSAPDGSPASPAPEPNLSPAPAPEPDPNFEEARRLLDAKEYRAVISHLESLPAAAQRGAVAESLRGQARSALSKAPAEARALEGALEARDVDGASRALSRLVEADPRHPQIPELTRRLNAELKRSITATSTAASAPASESLSPPPRETAPPPEAAPVPPERAVSASPVAVPTPPPPEETTHVDPKPDVVAEAPRQTEAEARQAILGVLQAYRAAFESLNADALRAIHPTVDYEKMKTSFASLTAYDVRIRDQSVRIDGDTATATCLVTYTPKPKPAGKIEPVVTVFHLVRSGAAVWIIERVEKK